jgi:PadR family transcriptional regulator PadR
MTSQSPLGEFEILILLAALRLQEDATGSRVRDEIEKITGRRVARGAVYVTMDRLEEKRLLASHRAAPTPERGGRPRRIYRVQPAGVRAVERSLTALARMRAGLDLAVGPL